MGSSWGPALDLCHEKCRPPPEGLGRGVGRVGRVRCSRCNFGSCPCPWLPLGLPQACRPGKGLHPGGWGLNPFHHDVSLVRTPPRGTRPAEASGHPRAQPCLSTPESGPCAGQQPWQVLARCLLPSIAVRGTDPTCISFLSPGRTGSLGIGLLALSTRDNQPPVSSQWDPSVQGLTTATFILRRSQAARWARVPQALCPYICSQVT